MSRPKLPFSLAILTILITACSGPNAAYAIVRNSPALGDVHFETTCDPKVQSEFDYAVALLHSFEFAEATRSFHHIEAEDPTCSISAWGVALSTLERLGPAMPNTTLASGWKELKPWLNRPAKSHREQMYISAVSTMYEGYEHTSSDERWNRYIAAMVSIRHQYPHDVNASLFYALALAWTAGPGAAGIEQRQQALAILLPIFHEHPDNPGAAHYIIHAADTPELAKIALPAARKYAAIAPDAPHALHMPSHIFNRLGLWQESVNSNLASARVAAAWVKEGRGGLGDELHALNNIEYGYLQLGQYDKAHGVVEEIRNVGDSPSGDRWAGKDARIYYDLEVHGWHDALALEPPPGSTFPESFDVYWIHTIACARLGMAEQAAKALDEFRKSSAEWIQGHAFTEAILHLALLQAEGSVLFAQGKREEAIATLNTAVKYEKEHPMYYADILPRPSSEVLGDMFLQMGKPSEALTAYRRSLEMAPNRHNSLFGEQLSAREIRAIER